MQEQIEQLESRTLFSVTADTLAADLDTIKADTGSVRVAMLASIGAFSPDVKKLAGDLKAAGGSANRALAHKLLHDAAETFAALRHTTSKIGTATHSVSTRAAAHGAALLHKSSATALAKVRADIAALNKVINSSTAQINGSGGANAFNQDITDAGTTNSSNAAIGTDLSNVTGDEAGFGAFLGAATTLATDTSTLATDLGTLVE